MRLGTKVLFEAHEEGIRVKMNLHKDENLFTFLTETLLALSMNGGESEVIVVCLDVLKELSSDQEERSSHESKEFIC